MDGGGGGGGEMSPLSWDRYSDEEDEDERTGRLTFCGWEVAAFDEMAAVVEEEVMVMRVVLLPLRPEVVVDDDELEEEEPDCFPADTLDESRFSLPSILRLS